MLRLLHPFVLTPISRQPLLTQLVHKSTYSHSILKKAAMESNRQRAQGKQKEQRAANAKLRGYKNESPAVRTSKTLSWILRHGSESLRLPMHPDGYVRVDEIVSTRLEVRRNMRHDARNK